LVLWRGKKIAESFDVVVLGIGNADMGVAHAAGKSAAIIESWDFGGTCPLRGCVPKKVLVAAAQTLATINQASEQKKFPPVMSPWTGVH
tara:strand:- start:16 stop:282 length:267 start_codon:yes stop_codon:yes gene_type:complete